ncbi:hypothetical protein SCATT_06000 [Streptantibioticus cattleyicolor NRRL 8057 = DSM 46488]|uniref:Uncharacterized protein n=2 Tax=Kitasatosporales TaxID=85011 RepID=F8JT36_STREN|nr:hypothetical protein SCATT_06000 [Streptantibioticus cattleyicolor NRRL 8057 = DSM 46488]MYS57714.1 hypothetical protein [Streptomyces sp. SID5468]CCB73332.1 protein of unknown function [Streptantibioticus cattleyicolor NRRL 8057 = DSM 46488]
MPETELPDIYKGPLEGFFQDLADAEPLERARTLSDFIRDIPELQKFAKRYRQLAVLEAQSRGIPNLDIARALDVQVQRVSGIARGHSGGKDGRPKADPTEAKLVAAKNKIAKYQTLADEASPNAPKARQNYLDQVAKWTKRLEELEAASEASAG